MFSHSWNPKLSLKTGMVKLHQINCSYSFLRWNGFLDHRIPVQMHQNYRTSAKKIAQMFNGLTLKKLHFKNSKTFYLKVR